MDVERGGTLELSFAPKVTSQFELRLLDAAPSPWTKPDLGIGPDDVVVTNKGVRVTVHSLGGVDAPESEVALIEADGRIGASTQLPALSAPHDLLPKTVTVTLRVRGPLSGRSIVLDPGERIDEITKANNHVAL